MSFKLLAIRPLEGTDPSLLKGLKPNCIYRFYNEYDYLYEEEQEDVSYIDYQDKYLSDNNNEKDNYLKLERKLIKAIKYNKQLPNDFFGENINVSAIVGENGSGKSSLLEFWYYFLFHYSYIKGVLNNIDANPNHEQECFIEIYFEYKNEIIKFNYECNGDTGALRFSFKNNAFEKIEEKTDKEFFSDLLYLKEDSDGENWMPKVYNIALNYGLYGLNSSVNGYGWIRSLFHKNDGYQTPIVINPMRTNGNIDINTEYRLLTQRLVINHFVIGNKKLLSNIDFDRANYSVEVYENQFYSYNINSNNIIDIEGEDLPLHQRKLESNDVSSLYDHDDLVIKHFKLFIKENYKEQKDEFSALQTFLQKIGEYSNGSDFETVLDFWMKNVEKNDRFVLNRDKGTLTIEDIQYLNLLYIFNKLYKMTFKYAEYKRFNKLFNFPYINNFNSEKEKQISKLSLVLEQQKGIHNEEVYTEVYDNFNVLEQLMNPNEGVNKKLRLKYIKEVILSDLKFNTATVSSNEIIDKIIVSIYQSKTNDLGMFIERVMTADTHIEFKVHQAISYFEKNTLQKLIDVKESKYNEKTGFYDLCIKKEYFSESGNQSKIFDINKVPIAFFNLDVLVKKNTERNSYSFRNLSSGEQQMINGLLTITYHLFNIRSVHQSTYGKIKYSIINIIMDEIELYFHPEYQRVFVKELKETLLYFPKFKYNVMMVTHSPFILSDIPSQNVLKLKEGRPMKYDDNIKNSFGANIHDLLADEFFLKDGFMGEFAKEKIRESIALLNWKINYEEFNAYIEEKLEGSNGYIEELISLFDDDILDVKEYIAKAKKFLFKNNEEDIVKLLFDIEFKEILIEKELICEYPEIKKFKKERKDLKLYLSENWKNIENSINLIGEPIVKTQLLDLFKTAFRNDIEKFITLEILQKQEEEIKIKIEKLKKKSNV